MSYVLADWLSETQGWFQTIGSIGFQHQLLRDILVPLHQLRIRLTRQTLLRYSARKCRASNGICEIKALYRHL